MDLEGEVFAEDERNRIEEEINQTRRRSKAHSMAERRGSINYDDCESTILRCKEENDVISNSVVGLKNTSNVHARRIKDLFTQFEDARVRLDKLLRRTTTSRRDFADGGMSVRRDSSFDVSSPRSSRREFESPRPIRMSSSARDYDSDAVSTRSSDTEGGGDGSRRGSCLSLMTTNLQQNFEMVSLTVKLDESGEDD